MREVFTAENEVDLAIVRGLLEEADIHYFVRNAHFGSLHVGLMVPLLNEKAVMVAPQDEARARAIIAAFFADRSSAGDEPRGDSW
jgi:hypothetical protein